MKKVSKKKVLEAVAKTKGLIAPAAKILGVTRKTLYDYIKNDKQIEDAVYDAREEMVDVAEGRLNQAVNNGDLTAIIFTLKTLGKSRGYIERQELLQEFKDPPTIPTIIIQRNEVQQSTD